MREQWASSIRGREVFLATKSTKGTKEEKENHGGIENGLIYFVPFVLFVANVLEPKQTTFQLRIARCRLLRASADARAAMTLPDRAGVDRRRRTRARRARRALPGRTLASFASPSLRASVDA